MFPDSTTLLTNTASSYFLNSSSLALMSNYLFLLFYISSASIGPPSGSSPVAVYTYPFSLFLLVPSIILISAF